jgi:glycosyltransferase involved in cell wall biosynthesis
VRVCLIYDCLYPHTIGGAELWYRNLAERLVKDGHDVTYLSLHQWEGADPGLAGVDVVAVGPKMGLYVDGRRRFLPPVVFGAGVLWHLLRHGRSYDAVHTGASPIFGLLAAAFVRPLHRYQLIADWHEVWTRPYWREYLGRLGDVGWGLQRLAIRSRHRAFCFSRLHAQRLVLEGFRGQVTTLSGEYVGALTAPAPRAADAVIVFAGRLIPEKQVAALLAALPLIRRQAPLQLIVYGEGPEKERLAQQVISLGLEDSVTLAGFVPRAEVDATLSRALCLVNPSRREGYGMIVVEALARATPAVVVAAEDNAAVELIDDGINGVIAADATPEVIAQAVLSIWSAGIALRQSTAAWYDKNAHRLSLEGSLETVLLAYQDEAR